MAKPRIRVNNITTPPDGAIVVEALEDVTGRWRVYSREAGHLLFGGYATRLPFLDAARELLKAGNDQKRTLAMVGADGGVRLSAELGYAARWSVAESDKVGPRFTAWKERPADLGATESSGGDDKSP